MIESYIAYGSAMYLLGLISCAILVWILLRITDEITIDQDKLERIVQEINKLHEEEAMRAATKQCMAQYCGV